jgi:hypothetical protein
MYENYIDTLKSSDVEMLLDSIYELSAEQGPEPKGEVRELLLKNAAHEDLDVRQIPVKTVLRSCLKASIESPKLYHNVMVLSRITTWAYTSALRPATLGVQCVKMILTQP